MTSTAIDQLINHIALVLDSSTSMQKHASKVIEVANGVISDLATMSKDFNQETRITIYQFSHEIKCLVYDKDVLRLPDISKLYAVSGNTALMAATVKAIDDLMLQPQIYGDHAFFNTTITDGEENSSWSFKVTVDSLKTKLRSLPNNWTIATLVPDERGIKYAVESGFSRENCGTWDTSSVRGFEGVAQTFHTATQQFFTNRSKGIRQTQGVFQLRTDNLNQSNVNTNTLTQLQPYQYQLYGVYQKVRIDDAVTFATGKFTLGTAYYQLMKPELIQPQKQICIREKSSGKVFAGQTRSLLGLAGQTDTVKVNPDHNPQYDIFVQSTAYNRNLVPNTEVLVMR